MFVYNVEPIDYFGALCPLHRVCDLPEEAEDNVKGYNLWMRFVHNALIILKDCTDWLPRENGLLIYVGSIPNPYEPAHRFMVIKQSKSGDNGDSYVVSEVPMPHLEGWCVESKRWNEVPTDVETLNFIRKIIGSAVLY